MASVTLIKGSTKVEKKLSKSKFVVFIPAEGSRGDLYLSTKMVEALKSGKENSLNLTDVWIYELKSAHKFNSLGGADKVLNTIPVSFTKSIGLPKVGRREF